MTDTNITLSLKKINTRENEDAKFTPVGYKTTRDMTPLGMPIFILTSDIDKSMPTGISLFPMMENKSPFNLYNVSENNFFLINGNPLDNIPILEKEDFSATDILEGDVFHHYKENGLVVVEVPIARVEKFSSSINSLCANFKYNSLTTFNMKDKLTTHDESNIVLVIVVMDLKYAVPTFGRKTKREDSLALMAYPIDRKLAEEKDRIRRGTMLPIILTNDIRCPFEVDGSNSLVSLNPLQDVYVKEFTKRAIPLVLRKEKKKKKSEESAQGKLTNIKKLKIFEKYI